jgi:hypothetical protein
MNSESYQRRGLTFPPGNPLTWESRTVRLHSSKYLRNYFSHDWSQSFGINLQ